MSLTLGEKLRQAREERGISISEVAEQTRISPMYLDSIEKDEYKPLPGGIFNKGFVRSYAKFIGLDEHEALQDYAKIVAENEGRPEPELKVYRAEVLTDDRAIGSMVPTIIFAGIILALMTGGILFAVSYFQGQPESQRTATNSMNSETNLGEATSPQAAPPMPSFDTIVVEFTALNERVALTGAVDGRPVTETAEPNSPRSFSASESIRLGYYRGFADQVEIKLNGKQISPPPAPLRGNSIVFEINRSNAAQIWQKGSISEAVAETTPEPAPGATASPAATPAPPKTPSATATPTPESTPVPAPTATPTPAETPVRTPSRTPTPPFRPPVPVPTATPD